MLAGLAGIGTAKAQFSGAYAPSNWSASQGPGFTGSANTSSAPASISLTSSDDPLGDVFGSDNFIYQITVPANGTISFDWNYSTPDGAQYDYPKYSVNGVKSNLTGYSTSGGKTQSGTQTGITVHAGDVFALIMYTSDNGGGAATTVFSNFSTSNAPLAITLTNISATAANGKNLITWNTAKEDRGDYFELERSANGKDFSRIATINANEKPSEYTYTDAAPVSGTNYYRLKMNDAEGKVQYSKVVTVLSPSNTKGSITLSAFPNPATDIVTVNIADATTGLIAVMDVTGKTVQSFAVNSSSTTLHTSDLPAGVYTIMYKSGENIATTQLVKK